jgi:transcriptional regulator with XRE-family HTH domain
MSNQDALAGRIGANLKTLRLESGLSQKSLAEATQLSPTLISRIESGLVRPSIATLELIAQSLKVDIGFFFQDEEKGQYWISQKEKRKTVPYQRGYNIETLVDGMENRFMDPAIITLKEKGEEEKVELATHEGQEFMYVLEGKVELILGSKRFVLKQGDAAYWNGSVPHKGVSLGKKPARTLNVHLIPGKRTGTFMLRKATEKR